MLRRTPAAARCAKRYAEALMMLLAFPVEAEAGSVDGESRDGLLFKPDELLMVCALCFCRFSLVRG